MTAGTVTDVDIVREALKAEYEIIDELGRGGMALVYKARDLELEREVAVKVLPFSLAFDAEFVERFQREARLSAQLEHPNIVPIYRVGRAGRVIYFTMKFLRGGALSSVLAERHKLSPPEIRRLLLEAGSALGYAAQRGIVHRDIKPDNIMFDEFGQVMLTDFGIAKAASGQKLTGTGMSIGTPHYMSPEQARAQQIDGRSDLYSLGVVAYQCLAGVVPYDGDDSFSIGYKHITEAIPTPALISADERRVYDVIRRMLMKDPADRYQSCEELIAALRGQPTAASGSIRRPTATPRPSTSASRMAEAGAPPAGAAQQRSLVDQPTTPITAQGIDRRSTAARNIGSGRRVADRSLVMRRGKGPKWLWPVLTVLAVVGGTGYYLLEHGFSAGQRLDADSTAVAADSGRTAHDTSSALGASTRDSAARADSTRRHAATPVPPLARGESTGTAAPADSGAIRVVGLPAQSRVLIDEHPVTDPVTRLPAGLHAVAVSAPRFNFYVDTIDVHAGRTEEVRPELTPIGAPAPPRTQVAITDSPAKAAPAPAPAAPPPAARCDSPGAGYNADGSCFDVRPRPKAPTFVPIPADAQGHPRPSVLWVHVSADGTTLDVRPVTPSNDTAFERDARDFARTMAWNPAIKDNAPVEAWTQWKFDPARQ